MEKIQKNISLETLYSRLPSMILPIGVTSLTDWYANYNSNWGTMPADINFTSLSGLTYQEPINKIMSETDFTNFKELSTLGIMSFRELSDRYEWCKDFLNNVSWYLCDSEATFNKIDNEITIYNDNLTIEPGKISYKIKDISFYTSYEALSAVTTGKEMDLAGVNADYDTFSIYGGFNFVNFVDMTMGRIKIGDVLYINGATMTTSGITGQLAPEIIFATDFNDLKTDLTRMSTDINCCQTKRFEKYGGSAMLGLVSTLVGSNYVSNLKTFLVNLADKKTLNHTANGYFETNPCSYATLPLFLSADSNINGFETPYLPDWEAGKTYYKGDVVYYNSESFVCTQTGTSGYAGFYVTATNSIVFDDNVYSPEGKIVLDSYNQPVLWPDSNGNYSHWALTASGSNTTKAVQTSFQSQLSSLTRLRTTFDDNGNSLNGLVNNITNPAYINIPYMVNSPSNYAIASTSDGEYGYGNMIYSIDDVNIGESGEVTTIEAFDMSGKTSGETGCIRFQYEMGGRIDKTNGVYSYNTALTLNGGVKMEEIYSYSIGSTTIALNSSSYQVLYCDIDFTYQTQDIIINGEAISNEAQMASASFYDNSLSNSLIESDNEHRNEVKTASFVRSYNEGLTSKASVISNVYIDRGSNAAFERHLKLGEVKTVQDLEAYGNGYFNAENNE